MRIRVQFRLLLAGIVFIPVILFVTMILVGYYRRPDRVIDPDSLKMRRWAETNLDAGRLQYAERYLKHMPPNVDWAVIRSDGYVLYSNIPEVAAETNLKDAEMMRLIRESSDRYLYQLDLGFGQPDTGRGGKVSVALSSPDGNSLLLITRVPRSEKNKADFFIDVFTILLIVFGIMLLFTICVSILIARSITQSVLQLEQAMRSLAGGNLETEITVKGSNEIIFLTDSLNKMRLSLRDQMRHRSRFIMGLSHDLRTPLSLIKGYTEAIRDGMVDDPVMLDKSLGIIESKIDQLEGLINSLIDSVRLDASEWKGKLSECAVGVFLSSYAGRMAADGNLLRRQVETSVCVPEEIIIQVDKEMFQRVLDNITSNAFRYTQEGGHVGFYVLYVSGGGPAGAYLSIRVTDDGCGISEKDMPYIFDSFYRGTNSRREAGYGFGLSAVKHIADTYGWSIEVQSEAGKGSVFTVIIPLG